MDLLLHMPGSLGGKTDRFNTPEMHAAIVLGRFLKWANGSTRKWAPKRPASYIYPLAAGVIDSMCEDPHG